MHSMLLVKQGSGTGQGEVGCGVSCQSLLGQKHWEFSDSLDLLIQPQPSVERAICLRGFNNPGWHFSTVTTVLGHGATQMLKSWHRLHWVFRWAEQDGLRRAYLPVPVFLQLMVSPLWQCNTDVEIWSSPPNHSTSWIAGPYHLHIPGQKLASPMLSSFYH